ncbi:hypothetical protein N1I81_22805 [Bacillus sp. FSL M8-0052]|uniref:hypothetical protein n=1 Tax=Bacillus sp. FSL M8-0052 TaxID=2978203 RepID=UPI0030F7C9F7
MKHMKTKAKKSNQSLFEKGFYIEDGMYSSESKIHTEEQLRAALLEHAEKYSNREYEGWDHDDYTQENIQDFNNKWEEKTKNLRQGTMDDLIKYIKDQKINLTTVHPDELSYEDYEKENNSKFIEVDQLRSVGKARETF